MKKTGFVVARNRAVDQFFTSSSAYDRPRWVSLSEATVYHSIEQTNTALTKLAKNGAYEARIVPVSELALDPIQQPNDEMVMADDTTIAEPDDEAMVANDQQEICASCDHEPCMCDDTDDETDVADIVQDQITGDDFEAGDEFAQQDVEGDEELDVKRVGESVEPIKLNDPASVDQKFEDKLSADHESSITVPSNVMSDLKAAIDEFAKRASNTSTRDDTAASFYLTVVGALEQIQAALEQKMVAGVKQAQILMTSMMNPITTNIPLSVKRFIELGGRKPSLKDMFYDIKNAKKGQ